MPQLVWTADPDGRVNYRSNIRFAAYAATNQTTEGQVEWLPLLHSDDIQRTLEAWQGAITSGNSYACEHRVRMADGTMRWHLSRAEPVRDVAGSIVKWIGTTTDIQDVKQAQERLREADQRKSEFLATLAHELRNPLAPIRHAAEILRLQAPSDPALRAAHDIIDRQIRHMVRLIDDLLEANRITRGQLRLQRERVELGVLLEQVLAIFRPQAEQAGLTLRVTVPSAPISLDADPVRLAQVFLNLLNNACKYTGRGGTIRLDARCDGAAVVVTVADTGIGIAAEHLPRVFEMFFQLDAGSGTSQGGLGIGLALARGLVELHGGHIEVRSPGPGQGTEFTVCLPTLAAPPAEPARVAEERDASMPFGAARILVVDDNADVLESLAMLLELTGFAVARARDGQEAIEIAEGFRPHLVLLDIGLPRLDGYGVCRHIRDQPWGKDMRIIALTGRGQDDARRRSRETGFDGHLVKPVDPADLRQLLTELP
jgi:PAS domain S-box-containing protein